MKISVFVRGEVTTKIFQAWQLQVPKRFNGCSVSSCCNADSECIVVGKSCTVDTFSLWTNGTILNVSVAIVSPEWLITSLKQGKLLPPDDFRIPQLCKKNVEVPLQNSKTGETSSVSENLVECVRESQTEVDPAKESLTDVEGFSQSQPSQLQSSQTAAGAQPSAISNNVESANQNEHITNMLDQLQAMYLQMGDQFRAQNYKKASATLKRIPRVSSVKDLEGRQGFGKSIKTSIAEILETGSLLKLKHLKKNPRSSAITLLSDIWGVGEKTAEQLYNQGFNNVSDIRSRGKHLLNRQQLIGLEYYEEFLTKIPRDEVGEIYRIVCEECLK